MLVNIPLKSKRVETWDFDGTAVKSFREIYTDISPRCITSNQITTSPVLMTEWIFK